MSGVRISFFTLSLTSSPIWRYGFTVVIGSEFCEKSLGYLRSERRLAAVMSHIAVRSLVPSKRKMDPAWPPVFARYAGASFPMTCMKVFVALIDPMCCPD